jgi:WD40 repeat protein
VLRPPLAKEGPVRLDFQFSSDGRWLVFQRDDRQSSQLWDATAGQLNQVLEKAQPPFAFSPDGSLLATAATDHTLKLWGLPTGRERLTLETRALSIDGIVFSPDSKLVASALNFPRVVRLWETETGNLVHSLTLNPEKQYGPLQFSPNGRFLLAPTFDGRAPFKLWDLTTSPPTDRGALFGGWTPPGASEPTSWPQPIFSPDGRWLALGHGGWTLEVRDAASLAPRTIVQLPDYVDVSWPICSPDGELVAVIVFYGSDASSGTLGRLLDRLVHRRSGQEKSAVRVFHAVTGEEVARFPGGIGGFPATFTADSKTLVAATAERDAKGDHSAIVALWEVPQRSPRGWLVAVGATAALLLAWAVRQRWRRRTRRGLPQ